MAAIQAVFLVALMVSIFAFGERIAQGRLETQTGAKAHLAALLLHRAVATGDAAAAGELADELVAGGAVKSIEVYDLRGARLAMARATGPDRGRAILARRPVVEDGREVGTVVVRTSGDFVDRAIDEVRSRLIALGLALILLSMGVSWAIGSAISWRLRTLRKSADAVAEGAFDLVVRTDGPPEVAAVARAMNVMARRLGHLYADINQTLEDRKRALASTFEHMSQGVAIFDAEGRMIEANAAFADLIGLPPESVVAGATLDALVDIHAAGGAYAGEGGARMEDICRRRDWPGPSMAFEMPFPDGRIVSVRRTRLPDGGFIAIHEDITRPRQDERRLLHAAKLTTLGRLATAAAHELNQPLNVIRLSADNAAARLATGAATTEYLTEKLHRIAVQTGRAARIIDHMRVFGRKPAEAPAPFDLGEAVRSAAEFFGETARLRGLRLDLSLEPGLVVSGHPALIEQVVANILSNAFAALADADVGSPRVTIRAERRGDRVWVEFTDNAGGVPADVLPRIFEPFFTTKSARDGTGLGLSISYGIVADMGGRLEVENRDDGAVFSFALEASNVPAPAAEAVG